MLGLARRAPASLANTSGPDIFELVRTFTKTRYHSLVLSHLNGLYLSLRGHLSDQIREVGFCRQRLSELLGLLQPVAAMTKTGAAAVPNGERLLFPPGCVDLQDAVHQLNQSVSPADLVAFDERVQAWISVHCQALLQVCMGSSTMVRTLAPALLEEAESFLGARMQGTSVADMYLTRKRAQHDEAAEAMILDDLDRCLDDATPEVGRMKEHYEISIVSLPNDESGQQLQKLLKTRHPAATVLLADRPDEIVFYNEMVRVQWQELEQLGPAAREVYERRCVADPSSLHTREDVFEWQVIAAINR